VFRPHNNNEYDVKIILNMELTGSYKGR